MSVTRYIVEVGGERKAVGVEAHGGAWEVSVDDEVLRVEQSVIIKDRRFSLMVGDHSFLVDLVASDWRRGRFVVNAIAEQIELSVRDELEAVAETLGGAKTGGDVFDLKAPMPGVVVRSLVAAGEQVERGQGLIVLEAMKMQNELASELTGIVQEIFVKDGQMVETGALLAKVIPAEGGTP